MQTKRNIEEAGNVLLCVLGVILVVSFLGATVLQNSTTRLNVSTNQVRAWKDALSAAESGGDVGLAEIRKVLSGATKQWAAADGWSPIANGYTKETVIPGSTLRANTVVEKGYFNAAGVFTFGTNPTGNNWYRLRSKGIAPLQGLPRTGMDDALTRDGQQHFGATGAGRGNGDSLLRKIDFKTDHFVATYGPNGDGLNKAQVVAPSAPSMSRRIEQIVSPVTPFFDTAIKAAGSFYGLGSAGQIDSYDSRKGHYYFCANNPSDPRYPDSRSGSVQIGSATATVMGMLYGDLSTNGAKVTGKIGNITGTIDNNVPFSLNDYHMPTTTAWTYVPPPLLGLPPAPGQLPSAVTGTTNLTPPARSGLPGTPAGGTPDSPTYYEVTTLSGTLTVNPTQDPVTGKPVDTYVAIRVSGNVTGSINVKGGTPDPTNPDKATGNVKLKIYYDGNINVTARNIVNQSPTASNPYAGNLQFYGISPSDGSARTLDINSPVGSVPLAATFYAPSADAHFNGNPDFIGTMVCKSFYGNGNVSWHYDRALNDDGELTGFRIVSYIEDTR